MPIAEIRKETERRMVVSIDALKAELKHLRTGRASVALLEGVHVEYYGTATPLKTTKEKGMTCRLLEITNQAGGLSGRSELTFCKTKDGWKIP